MQDVTALEKTANSKTGSISVMHAAQGTCPNSCPLKDGGGCYAEGGFQAFTTRRLNRATVRRPVDVARREAELIDGLTGKRALRVHVVGDCRTAPAARHVGAAMVRHTEKHGKRAWTYTHAWRDVPASAWQGASVLASCENAEQVRQAKARGYTRTCMITAEHRGRMYEADGLHVVACPNQLRAGTQCIDCNLCAADHGLTVAFAAHGAVEKTRAHLGDKIAV